MGLGKDGLSNSVGDVVPNVGSPLQAAGSMMPRGDTDMLMKWLYGGSGFLCSSTCSYHSCYFGFLCPFVIIDRYYFH
ncbi:hypothetical protein RchiOBHm_Chr7g0208541 [Rosa chinensis]|uniref:Uncharacterized protein n=1 Tax=Rosa chinensis TaxID=74649 RepID=A0A2P6P9R1_ROSCH|nr:hypothetical protein RchiOBHm_Chr7g0208541 [Rosa chinensis]